MLVSAADPAAEEVAVEDAAAAPVLLPTRSRGG